ncbi:MAG: DUF4357 domain-containing protein [Ruminococcus sp.]|nr:DUF4357 domain-containing protein [Ruminococcus sp.]
MSRGIIYIMETVVPGLIKIGKTSSDNFEQRMYSLERNGYNNVVGLKRRFAIEVEEYDEKEILLHNLFDKSRLQNSELFATDINLVIQLLTSFEGKQIYPENETKEHIFADATENRQIKGVPDGIYYLNVNKKGFGKVTAEMKVENGRFIVLKGSICVPISNPDIKVPESRRTAIIQDNILMEDKEFNSPSKAGLFILGTSVNGWIVWKTVSGKPIDIFRNNQV